MYRTKMTTCIEDFVFISLPDVRFILYSPWNSRSSVTHFCDNFLIHTF